MNDNVYLGNPNLKKANTPINFTEEQIVEFIKCREDPVYFAINYIKIVTLDHGLQPFKLYPFQQKLLENFMKIDLISVRCLDRQVNLQPVYHIYCITQFSTTMLI